MAREDSEVVRHLRQRLSVLLVMDNVVMLRAIFLSSEVDVVKVFIVSIPNSTITIEPVYSESVGTHSNVHSTIIPAL